MDVIPDVNLHVHLRFTSHTLHHAGSCLASKVHEGSEHCCLAKIMDPNVKLKPVVSECMGASARDVVLLEDHDSASDLRQQCPQVQTREPTPNDNVVNAVRHFLHRETITECIHIE